jgi:hypothetical protein
LPPHLWQYPPQYAAQELRKDHIMRPFKTAIAATGLALLAAGCATVSAPGPVEVTRFHNAAALNAPQERTVFIASAEGQDETSFEMSAYKRAVAAELATLGYREAPRRDAQYTAQVSLDRYNIGEEYRRRSPVSVGVGGSTGSYGSGVGLGIGINLGGNRNRERVGTQLGVMLKDRANGETVWEGRADWSVDRASELASPVANAPAIANALFSEFPGGNGETVEIRVDD